MPPPQFVGQICDPRDVSLALRLFKDYQTPEMQKLYLFTQEGKPHLRPSPTYLADVQARGGFAERDTISVGHRRTLVDWLYELSQHFYPKSSLSETFQLAVNFLDRASALRPLALPEYQRLGGACFLIASKVVETHPPSCRELSELSGGAFNPRLLQAMELWVISGLKWNLNPPTPHMFLDPFMNLFPLNEHDYLNIYRLALQYLDSIQREYEFLQYRPSVQALAALQCAFTWRGAPHFHGYVSAELARLAEGPTVMISSLIIPRMREIALCAAEITSRMDNKPPVCGSARRTSQHVTHSTQVQHGLATPVVNLQDPISCSNGGTSRNSRSQVDTFFGDQKQQEQVAAKASARKRSAAAAGAHTHAQEQPKQPQRQQLQHQQQQQYRQQQEQQRRLQQQQQRPQQVPVRRNSDVSELVFYWPQPQPSQLHLAPPATNDARPDAHRARQLVAPGHSDSRRLPTQPQPQLQLQQHPAPPAAAYESRPASHSGTTQAQTRAAARPASRQLTAPPALPPPIAEFNLAPAAGAARAERRPLPIACDQFVLNMGQAVPKDIRELIRKADFEAGHDLARRQEIDQEELPHQHQLGHFVHKKQEEYEMERMQQQRQEPQQQQRPVLLEHQQQTQRLPARKAMSSTSASTQPATTTVSLQQQPPAAPRRTRAATQKQQQLQQQQQQQQQVAPTAAPPLTYTKPKQGRKRAAGGPPPVKEQVRKRAAKATFPTPDEQLPPQSHSRLVV
ncbi:hypothetical protein HDU87_001683 [Geranomyces variabilis]|uniref:Cyclin-like domain-containing protein n=1 Tax=Geranomyces variabilis TaxID=109894 RepID=A0AAD5TDC3_9FUNG|nr:hypothetical protein HDU87_001683 [Geranomyces variabilis]